jgi:hypothetical protein
MLLLYHPLVLLYIELGALSNEPLIPESFILDRVSRFLVLLLPDLGSNGAILALNLDAGGLESDTHEMLLALNLTLLHRDRSTLVSSFFSTKL